MEGCVLGEVPDPEQPEISTAPAAATAAAGSAASAFGRCRSMTVLTSLIDAEPLVRHVHQRDRQRGYTSSR
jgi:hypothetical protein